MASRKTALHDPIGCLPHNCRSRAGRERMCAQATSIASQRIRTAVHWRHICHTNQRRIRWTPSPRKARQHIPVYIYMYARLPIPRSSQIADLTAVLDHRSWLLGDKVIHIGDAESAKQIMNAEHDLVEGNSCMHMNVLNTGCCCRCLRAPHTSFAAPACLLVMLL